MSFKSFLERSLVAQELFINAEQKAFNMGECEFLDNLYELPEDSFYTFLGLFTPTRYYFSDTKNNELNDDERFDIINEWVMDGRKILFQKPLHEFDSQKELFTRTSKDMKTAGVSDFIIANSHTDFARPGIYYITGVLYVV